MAETEVSKMVAIEEKCGLDMSSYQDLPKSDCNGTDHRNQTNDLDNSYVFVNGADGLPDGAVGDKDVVIGGVPPEPKGSQNEKIGAVCEKAYNLNEGVNGDVELSNGDSNPVNYNTCEQESSHEDGDGSVTDSPVVQTCEIESSPEAEQVSVADSQVVHTEVTKSVVEEDFKQVEDSDGKTESISEAEVDKTVDQNEGIEGAVEGQQVDIDGVTIAEPPPLHVENYEVQVRALELVAEIGEDGESNKIFSNSNSPNSPDDGEGHQSNTSVTEALEAQQRSEEIVVDADEHELQSVAVEAEDEEKSTREIAEDEVSTSLEAQQRSEDIVVDADEHELQSVAVEAEDEEKSTIEIAEDEVSTSLEAQQRSEDIVVGADEHELQSVAGEAEDEEKSTREIAEVAEIEVPTSTSLESESFSINNKDKILEEEGKTESSLSVLETQHGDTGASNVVQDMVGETDESKPVGSSSDSHVQITCGLVLDEKNVDSSVSEVGNGARYLEDSQELPLKSSSDSHAQNEDPSVSEVENSAQYHEESQKQPVGSSSNSHVQATEDLLLEGKNGDSSVSDVGNGFQYHEESEEPVGSDSHVQTICGLVLEEKNEDFFESEIENGVHYHEESQEQPVVSRTDSQVQTTCDLASEGNNEVSSVSEIENDAQYCEPQEQPVVSSTCDLVLEEKEEEPSVSEVENGSKYTEESREQPDGGAASHDTTPSEAIPDASVQIQSNPASNAWAPQSGTEVSDVEEIGRVSSPLVVDQESQSIKKVVHGHDIEIRSTLDVASSGSHCALDMVVQEKEIAFEGGDDDHSETDVSSGNSETDVSSGKSKFGDSSPGALDVKLESDSHVCDLSHVHDLSVRTSGEKSDDLAVSCRTDISDSLNVKLDAAVSIESDVDGVADTVDKLDGASGNSKENLFVQENENTRNSQNEETSVASAGVSTMNTTDGEKSIEIKTKPFNFLIRTPRFDDEDLREQIRLAKLQVDEKTKLRDAIQLQIQEKRQANSQINGIDYEFSKGEGRSARKLVRSKRMEIDSLQSVINKAKNALSIEDIDSQIQNMEHMIQHETLLLKEEKQLIREIKQLKQLREQLSSNMGSQDEIKQALEQREEIEGRLKILRKELDVLKNRVLKAEATAAEAGKKYDDENRKVKELQAQFRAADEVRQAAYAQWQNLRKEFSKKNKYFFKYKDDAAVASNCAFSRDTEALYRLCTNQVGSFMELWNTNPEFRRDYIKFNSRSNIRRFGTLDCRSLGPDEDPPAKPIYTDERSSRMASTPAEVNQAPRTPCVEPKQKTPNGNVASDSKSIKKVTEPKSQEVLNGPAINNVQVNGFDASTRSDLTNEVHEEPIRSKDEIEAMRKEEEMRKEKAEAKLKEQRRLEALEKANEARERKKRQAEKLQQRAEMKTRKEAEQREREREKRLRKKERKKGGMTDANDTNNNCETAPSSESAAENSKEIDAKDAPPAAAKKPSKPWLTAKQSKTKSIPPSLRNRNKKKLQQWMWVGITSFIILVLFWMGNIGVFSNVALKRRPPVY